MAIIKNEIDMFNHIFEAGRRQVVEIEPEAEFRRGLQALEGVLFHVEKKTHFGGKLIMFKHMMNEVAVLCEDLGDGNLRLTYEVVVDFDAKFR